MFSDDHRRHSIPDKLRDFADENARLCLRTTRDLTPGKTFGTMDRESATHKLVRLFRDECLSWADPEEREVIAPFLDSMWVKTPVIHFCADRIDKQVQADRKSYLDRASSGVPLKTLRDMDEFRHSVLSYKGDGDHLHTTKYAEDMYDWEIEMMFRQKAQAAARLDRESEFLETLLDLVREMGTNITVGEAIDRAVGR